MNNKIKDMTLTALFAAVICISGIIRIPAGPVPLTLQTQAILISSYCLGWKNGAVAALIYMALGLLGAPVFTSGGGPAYVLSPTFGFIFGFVLCSAINGLLSKLNPENNAVKTYIHMLTSMVFIYLPGVLWLIFVLNIIADVPSNIDNLLKAGLFIPFAVDLVKNIPAAYITVRLRKSIFPQQ